MKRTLVKFRNSKFRKITRKYEKYAPITFFIGGFIFDSLTLGRVDRLYDLVVLCLHMSFLTVALFLYNLVGDGRWKNTWFERYEEFLPLAIQFSFGGLSSAYVVYFARSVSLSKTVSFFIILIALLLANEFLKKRISNKYLQFSVYFFVSFTFFTFMIPVFIKEMSSRIFMFSGLVSLASTLALITIIFGKSQSTRREINKGKLLGIIALIYTLINVFYFFRLIPPVPLALDEAIVAHDIRIENGDYIVTYEADAWYVFWRDHRLEFSFDANDRVYIFSSIFAPTHLKKSMIHRWQWYNESTSEWEIIENIGYEITGGRNDGFRGYTYKSNVKPGAWKVEIITDEELLLGVVDFQIVNSPNDSPRRMVVKRF